MLGLGPKDVVRRRGRKATMIAFMLLVLAVLDLKPEGAYLGSFME